MGLARRLCCLQSPDIFSQILLTNCWTNFQIVKRSLSVLPAHLKFNQLYVLFSWRRAVFYWEDGFSVNSEHLENHLGEIFQLKFNLLSLAIYEDNKLESSRNKWWGGQ